MPLHRVDGFGELDHVHHCASDGSCRHAGKVWPTLPFAPLAALTRFSTARELGMAVGRTTRCVQRWQRDGVPVSVADEVACRLGFNPVSVWPEWEHIG